MIERTVTVWTDTREHYPLTFPATVLWRPDPRRNPTLLAVKAEAHKLDTGDYCLACAPQVCVVERKAGIRELTGNFTTQDVGRMTACLARLTACCTDPLLVIESTPAQLTPDPEADLVLVKAFAICRKMGVPVWVVPGSGGPDGRRRVGRLVLLRLLAAVAPEGI